MRGFAVILFFLGCACQVPNPAYSVYARDGGTTSDAVIVGADAAGRGSVDVLVALPVPDVMARQDAPPMIAVDTAPPVPANLLSGLVSYWPLDEVSGKVAGDPMSGNQGNVDNPQPDTIWRSGHTGGAATFDWMNGWAIEVPASQSINQITQQITVAAWVMPVNTGDRIFSVISRQLLDSAYDQYLLGIQGHEAAFFMEARNPLRPIEVNGSAVVPDGVWTHLAATHDGTTARLYVNGQLDGSMNFSPYLVASSKPVFVGSNINMGDRDRRETWNGLLDEVVLYNRALSQAEIVQLMQLNQRLR